MNQMREMRERKKSQLTSDVEGTSAKIGIGLKDKVPNNNIVSDKVIRARKIEDDATTILGESVTINET